MNRRQFLGGLGAVTVMVAGGGVWRAVDQGVFQAPSGDAYTPWRDWRDAEGSPLALVKAGILAAAVLAALLAAILLARALWAPREPLGAEGPGWGQAGLVVGLMAAYILALTRIGFGLRMRSDDYSELDTGATVLGLARRGFVASHFEFALPAPGQGSSEIGIVVDKADVDDLYRRAVGVESGRRGAHVGSIHNWPSGSGLLTRRIRRLGHAVRRWRRGRPPGRPDRLPMTNRIPALSFALLVGPAGMAVDNGAGRITWSPSAGDLGNHTVTIRVDDGRGGAAEQTYQLSVIEPPPNRPPVFASAPPVDGFVNRSYAYLPVATDEDGDIIIRRLDRPVPAERIMLPGRCRADLNRLSAHFGLPVERGPDELKDIPAYFGRKGRATDMSKYDIRIFAEIVEASGMSVEAICERSAKYASLGADVIAITGDIYSHVAPGMQAAAVARVAAIVDGGDAANA